MRNRKGFTLMEVLLVMVLMGILSTMIPIFSKHLYGKALLQSTANEAKVALHLAQQLSIDESTAYCVEVVHNTIRVRKHAVGGKVVMLQDINKIIRISPESHERISYNVDGVTSYGQFVFENPRREKIKVQVAIGTGKVKVFKE